MRLVREAHAGLLELPGALDPHVVRPVDHHLGDRLVAQEPLERAVAERVVGDLVDHALSIGDGQPALLLQPAPDVAPDPRAQARLVQARVEQLGTELGDHRVVDAVGDLRHAVAGLGRLGGADRPRAAR